MEFENVISMLVMTYTISRVLISNDIHLCTSG